MLRAAILALTLAWPFGAQAQAADPTPTVKLEGASENDKFKVESSRGWTTETTHLYYDKVIELESRLALSERVHLKDLMDEREKRALDQVQSVKDSAALALSAQQEASQKATISNEKQFDAVKQTAEVQAQLIGQLIPRKEFEVANSALTSKMDDSVKLITARLDLISNRVVEANAASAGSTSTWGLIGGIIVIICTLLGAVVSVCGFVFVIMSRHREQDRRIRETEIIERRASNGRTSPEL